MLVNIRTLSKKKVLLIPKLKLPGPLILLIGLAVVPQFVIHNYEFQRTENRKSYHDAFGCKVRPNLEWSGVSYILLPTIAKNFSVWKWHKNIMLQFLWGRNLGTVRMGLCLGFSHLSVRVSSHVLVWKLGWGRIHFQDHSGCWQNSCPEGDRA